MRRCAYRVEDLGVDGRIILIFMFREIGCGWDDLAWDKDKWRAVVTEKPLASEGLCCTEVVKGHSVIAFVKFPTVQSDCRLGGNTM
jgi:hypothetical protein